MKTRLTLLIVLLAVTCTAMAQEEPIPPRRTQMPKMGLFGGFTPSWLNVDTGPINEYLRGAGVAPLGDGGVVMLGGAGAIYIMVVPNLRLGGVGMSGSTSSSALVGNVRKEANLTVGYGGVTVEYVFQLVPRLDLAVGTMLGAGGMDITLRQDAGVATTWENEWLAFRTGNYQSASQIGTVRRDMSGSFFLVIPSATVEYAVLGWLAVRVGVSYVAMLAPSWSLDGEHDLLNVPSSVKGNGFMVNGGILLGTF